GESDMFERFMERRDPQELLEPQEQQQPELQNGAARRLTADGVRGFLMAVLTDHRDPFDGCCRSVLTSANSKTGFIHLRQAEIRKSRSQFERNLVSFTGSRSFIKINPVAVVFTAFIKSFNFVHSLSNLKQVTKLETLNQKNVALRLKVKNLLQQLKQKKERHEKTVLWVLSGSVALHLLSSQERLRAEAQQQRLRRQLEDFQVPHVSQYMRAKAKLRKLQAAVHSTDRKVAVAEVNICLVLYSWDVRE
uniref:Uncharacterized protein n=1 Tax=Oryzias sinensis TaxID=183150 RepID=A0A8C8DNT3_9TELE